MLTRKIFLESIKKEMFRSASFSNWICQNYIKKIHVSRFIITNIAERVIATYTKSCEGFV